LLKWLHARMHRSVWAFAAESHDLDTYAQGKRVAKSLPLVVGNLVSDGLGGEDNQVVLYDAAGRHPMERAPKARLHAQYSITFHGS
jgi:phosphopantothenoylcysteine synthetase/decarboxylase